jgi:hypothetical protein
MIRCTKCNYGWNPDTATSCVQCKTPLAGAALPQRSDTLGETSPKSDIVRNPTLAESTPYISQPVVPSAPAMPSTPVMPPIPSVTPVNSAGGDAMQQGARRQTVFAGTGNSGEVPIGGSGSYSGNAAGRTPISSGTRRPQTIAVDPGRKIVGVLITYSWQESGQVFPVLEGRNLIGKDPEQCDICIPQDATLSAVNSFITYRKHFLIGDKVSMSGTDVDGEPIETEFVPLRNYAKIRTGSTYWTFVCIQPPAQGADDAGSGS